MLRKICMKRHSTFISLVAVLKFLANGDRSQKVANAVLAYLRAFRYQILDFVRSRTGPICLFWLILPSADWPIADDVHNPRRHITRPLKNYSQITCNRIIDRGLLRAGWR